VLGRIATLAAGAALGCAGLPQEDRPARPAPGEADLRIVVERHGHARRLAEGEPLALGDRLFFRVSSSRAGAMRVWVEGPAGHEPIAWVAVRPEPVDLRLGNQLVAYELSKPGTHTFYASLAEGPPCEPPACVERTLEAE